MLQSRFSASIENIFPCKHEFEGRFDVNNVHISNPDDAILINSAISCFSCYLKKGIPTISILIYYDILPSFNLFFNPVPQNISVLRVILKTTLC